MEGSGDLLRIDAMRMAIVPVLSTGRGKKLSRVPTWQIEKGSCFNSRRVGTAVVLFQHHQSAS
jgi:hypothetical protein